MADIPFPLNVDLVECTFLPVDNLSVAYSGRKLAVIGNRTRTFDPLWRATIETGPMHREQRAILSAWYKSLKGGLNTFTMYDFDRLTPFAYPDATQPEDISVGWDGTSTISVLGAGDAVTLNNVPVGYQAKIGDRLGITQSGKHGYYEIIADATANGSGDVTLTVWPSMHNRVFNTSAIANLWRPVCKFIIDWQSWEERAISDPTPLSFNANQTIL